MAGTLGDRKGPVKFGKVLGPPPRDEPGPETLCPCAVGADLLVMELAQVDGSDRGVCPRECMDKVECREDVGIRRVEILPFHGDTVDAAEVHQGALALAPAVEVTIQHERVNERPDVARGRRPDALRQRREGVPVQFCLEDSEVIRHVETDDGGPRPDGAREQDGDLVEGRYRSSAMGAGHLRGDAVDRGSAFRDVDSRVDQPRAGTSFTRRAFSRDHCRRNDPVVAGIDAGCLGIETHHRAFEPCHDLTVSPAPDRRGEACRYAGAVSNEIEIGRGKRGRRAYAFDDVAIVPSRRTRDPHQVSLKWQIDAFHFDIPLIAAPMDSVMSPATAIALGRMGGLGVLNLEGLWTRYEDPAPLLEEIAGLAPEVATRRMQEIYSAPIDPTLITERLKDVRAAGVTVAGALSPHRTQQHYKTVLAAGVDLFFIRGTTVSAEHVSGESEPLNLKKFIYDLDVPVIVGGASTYQAALHLMRTGAAGVLVGFGGGAAHTTRTSMGIHAPMATAVADVAAARRDYLDESGGRYVHVIADGGLGRSGDMVKAIACGSDAIMVGAALARATEAPGRGYHWGLEAHHPELPRGERVHVGTVGSLEEIVLGPGTRADGTVNLMGALRRSMATTGYSELKEFQRVDVVVSPYQPH